MIVRAIKIALAAVILFSGASLAKSAKDQQLELIHADKLITSGQTDDNQLVLVGNVHLRHGSTELWSDRAVWYKQNDLVVFIDSVQLIDSTRSLSCQHLTYYRKSGSALAVGEVEIVDPTEQVQISANKVDYNKTDNKFIATGGPKLVFYPDNDSSRSAIVGDSIIYDVQNQSGQAINNVIITRKDITATSGRADFIGSEKPEEQNRIIRLSGPPTGQPQVKQGENVLEGEQIELQIANKTLVGMLVEDKAKATYREHKDTLSNKYDEAILEGKQLEAYFADDKIEKAVMRSNATSYYYPERTADSTLTRNIASGDSITLFFEGSEITRVLIIGGAQGNYSEAKIDTAGKTTADTTFYDAQQIDYLAKDDILKLLDKGRIRYQSMSLEAGMVKYSIKDEIMIAEGIYVQSDSGEVLEQAPVLSEGSDKLEGKRMTYNISTRKGKVELGETEYDQAFLFGDELRQINKDVYYIRSGRYIPCEDKEGGVYFYSSQMKIIVKDKAIGRPVVMFLGPLPVFALPYFVFPIEKGRRSGILEFEIGNLEQNTRYIRNIGYYWAASDYWDALASLDYYQNQKTIINGKVNYKLRYNFSGYVSSSFTRKTTWNSDYERSSNIQWRLNYSHTQDLADDLKLAGSGTFMSSKDYNLDNSYDEDERLNRTMNSSMSLVKSWQGDYLSSLSILVKQSWNLDTDEKERTLPSISFSTTSFPLFPAKKADPSKRVLPWIEEEEEDSHWYQDIKFKFQTDYAAKGYYSEEDVYTETSDSTTDTTAVMDWKKYQTLNSTMNLGMAPKLFNVLTVKPAISFKNTIYKIDQIHEADSAYADSLGLVTNDYFFRNVWSTSITMSTVMYGTFYPNVLGITGFRHTVTPSVSYSYAPKTDKNKQYQSFTGVGSSSSRKRNMTFSLSNVFQMKVKSGEEQKKIDLFNLNFSTGYDFEADSTHWSPLTSSLEMKSLPIVSMSLSATHNLYKENTSKFQPWDPTLTSLTISTGFSRTFTLGGESDEKADSTIGDGLVKKNSKDSSEESDNEPKTSLSVDLGHRYVKSRSDGVTKVSTNKLTCSFDLKLTSGWGMALDFNYDLKDMVTEVPVFTVKRDLNCWAGEFEWRPGDQALAGYYVKIYIKQIPDIKVEQTIGNIR